MKDEIIEIEQRLAADHGAEEYYEHNRVNLTAVLMLVAVIRKYGRDAVLKTASSLGSDISDHTLLLIEQLAEALK